MNRYVLTVHLKNDPAALEAYRRHHAAVWPEVVESLRASGVRHMDIHLLGRQLVMVLELEDGLDVREVFATHSASTPRVAEWEALMKSLQEPVDGAGPGEWWAIMEPVFRLESHQPVGVQASERRRQS